MKKLNRVLALVLSLCMLLSLLPAATAVEEENAATNEVAVTELENVNVDLTKDTGDKLETEDLGYAAEDLVDVIVVLEDEALLDQGYTKKQIAKNGAELQAAQEKLAARQDALLAEIASVTAGKATIGYRYNVVISGFSVEIPYGKLAEIQALEGVRAAFVAPTFSVPEDMTANSAALDTDTYATSDSFGSALTWQTAGYTGTGMRIAILDTGLDTDHPSFADAPELNENSLSAEEVAAVVSELNAAENYAAAYGTELTVEDVYYSEKIPFGFNYATTSLDITHDNDQAGDHGTHVAGIAAANALDTVDVVGVAPDAQVIVMKIFQPTGGAAFTDLVAAMEDCFRLDVDVMNMSLGADAGFTTIGYDIWEEIFSKINENDMIAAVSAGNAYSAAYGNGYGTNKNLSSDPDNGIVSAPGTWPGATMIASSENDSTVSLYFTVGDSKIIYSDIAGTPLYTLAGTELQYVMVPGVGSVEDFASVDVSGKVAVVSRGEIDFTAKQTNAYDAGAVACIVYDNAEGELIYMLDAELLPNVFISKADGEIMAANAVDGVGTMTVMGSKDFIPVPNGMAGQMSDFSSWGVTPDLELAPEVTAPGGNIYSSVNNGEYGLMSGTSMAAPHVSGMAALVLQYLHEQYPDLTDAELHTAAEALIMSTATPMMEYEGVEYSPRKQGAGLANVYDAINSASYLTVNGSTPKASLGDNDTMSGSFSFSFELTNLSDAPKSYALDASVLTDYVDTTYASIGYLFMGETSLKLSTVPTFYIQEGSIDQVYDANVDGVCDLEDVQYLLDGIVGLGELPESEIFDLDNSGEVDTADAQLLYEMITSGLTESDVVVVEGGQTVSVTVDVQLTESDMSYMNTYYPNGIYMDGFVRLYALDEGNSDLSLPFVGFYGDWSAAPVLDSGWYYDEYLEYNRYPNILWTSMGGDYSYLGFNPYAEDGYNASHNVVSPNGDGYLDNIDDMYISLMRNAKTLDFTYTDTVTGEVLYQDTALWASKSYYLSSYAICYPFVYSELFTTGYGFTDAEGNYLPNGTHVTLTIDAYLDDGDDLVDETVQVPITVDTQAPELLNVKKFHNVEGDEVELELTFKDNVAAAAVGLLASDGTMIYALDVPQLAGYDVTDGSAVYAVRYDVTGLGDKLMLVLADYAVNERYYGLNLNGEGASYGDLVAFQYNYNTGIDGWVAFNEDVNADETTVFVSDTSFVAAEYVNGYIYAQTESGALYGFSYESMLNDTMLLDMTYIAQLQNVYQDLAYSYAEGKLYGLYTSEYDGYPTSELYSINLKGAYYDESLWADVAPYEEVWMASRGGVYGLTMAIDDAGTVYMLGTNYDWETESVTGTAHLWVNALEENSWSGAMELSWFVDTGDTGLTMDYLQSMTWDHNTDTLYWARFAPNGLNLDCQLLTVDPTTAECAQVGTLSGETCALIAPLTEETAAQESHANVPEMDSSVPGTPVLRDEVLTMNVGGTKTLICDFDPWYTEYKDLVWTSSDEAVVTVDANGTVTAVGTGSAVITAANAADETKLATCTVEVTALDLKLEGVISAQSAGIGNVTGVSTYEYTMVDGIASFGTVNSITAPEELNYGLALATSVYGRGSIWACEYGNTGMVYEIDAATGVVKDALQPIDGDMLFGMAYSEKLDTFTGIMNMYLYVDLPLTHEVEDEMLGSYDDELNMFTWHRLNMLPYLLESNTGFTTNETGNGASSEIVFCGVTVIDNNQNYYLSSDYMGNYTWYETTYTPDQTLVLLDNVGRIWYIDELTNMTRTESEWGDVTYTSADGMNIVAGGLNGVEALEYVDEEGNSTYSVFIIRELAETPLTDMFREGSLPRITYHFSDIEYAGDTAEGAPMFVMSLYDYWNNGTTNELYLYVPGVGTGEFTYDENWNYVELKTPDRLYSLGNTGEYNIIATIHKAEVTGGVDSEASEEGTEETTAVRYLNASVYTGK